jgi:acetoin utilization protein AcuC
MPKAVFLYSEEFLRYDYGLTHPLKMRRLRLVYDLLRAYGVFADPDVALIEPTPAREEDVLCFHTEEYVSVLRALDEGILPSNPYAYGLGPGDNPIFPGLYRLALLITGSSLEAARLVEARETPVAFSVAGGLHHALPDRASGFCYLDDPVIAIMWLLERGRRVAYVDIDAHHGDGVQLAFYDTDRVLTISFHEDGRFLFPGTGFVDELGVGAGYGYSVNIPLYPGTDDETYVWAFEEIVPPLLALYQPDVLVTQLGVDSFATDPLTDLRLTTHGYTRVVERLKSLGLPWIALGGGGYNLSNVARAWTLAFAIMCGIELPDEIPPAGREALRREGLEVHSLRDPKPTTCSDSRVREQAEKSVRYIQEHVLQRWAARS